MHLLPATRAHAPLARLLDGLGAGCALYVLGDLFDLWLGDDLDLARHGGVLDTLRAFHARGGRAQVMAGNHDFLLGAQFFARTGARPLPDPTVLMLGEQRWLLTHGDQLCTADVAYQALRTRIRDPDYVRAFLALPATRRKAIAHQLRTASDAATAHKSVKQMDVDPHAVQAVLKAHDAQVMVHGHTHRPGVETLPTNPAAARAGARITLGSWVDGVNACVWEAGTYRLIGFPAPE